MNDISTQYPTLDHFFGVYLDQDWLISYGDEWTAVDDFIADGRPGAAELFRTEIALLLAQHSSEDELATVVFEELGCCLNPEVDGWTFRDWLQALSQHAAKAVGTPAS
jgi:hypothetical protein